jgi:hypothetical protein
MKNTNDVVYGERIGDLLPRLLRLADSMRPMPGEMYELAAVLDRREAPPVMRALLRAEAELLLEDAETYGSDAYEERTHEQRAADAFVRLARALDRQRR